MMPLGEILLMVFVGLRCGITRFKVTLEYTVVSENTPMQFWSPLIMQLLCSFGSNHTCWTAWAFY